MNFKVSRYRDLTIVDMGESKLVIACDSTGSIGEKEADALRAPLETVGSTSARVPLMEVIASGASVVAVIDTVSCEMEPSARRMLIGIREELAAAGVDDVSLNGSTEENFPTAMTAVGITVIGVDNGAKLKLKAVQPGSKAYLFGKPLVGQEVLDCREEMSTYSELKSLLQDELVEEIVPVGSKGARYEASLLAELNGVSIEFFNCEADIDKSAGPASCFIAAIRPEWIGKGKFEVIGKFV